MQNLAQAIDLRDGASRAKRVVYEHRFLFGFAAIYIAAGMSFLAWFDLLEGIRFLHYKAVLLIPSTIAVGIFFIGYLVYVMVAVRPASLFTYYYRDLRTNWLTTERIVGGLIAYTTVPAVTTMFSSIKAAIPIINPFSWDETFYRWDYVLHGRVDPWELLQPVLGYPLITSFIGLIYNSWFFLVYSVFFWQAFSLKDRRLRMQFLISFVMVSAVIGNILAMSLSSAGPIYFSRITGLDDPYEPLFYYLYTADKTYPVWVLNTQEVLWYYYAHSVRVLGSGISAMPSVHVAQALVIALLGWRVNRTAGIVLSFYAVVILLGSVHLAWHYAIDGYVAVAVTLMIWYLVGRLLPDRFGLDR